MTNPSKEAEKPIKWKSLKQAKTTVPYMTKMFPSSRTCLIPSVMI